MTLYDDLGVTSHATADDLRRAYRSLARRTHPDVNDQADSEQMLRLNRAWAVLGDPAAKAEYDRTLGGAADPPIGPAPVPGHRSAFEDRASSAPPRWLRPSSVILAVLLLLFIVTAYAGPHHTGTPVPPVTSGPGTTGATVQPASGLVESALIGKCLLALPGYDAVVPCSGHSDGVVVAETTRSADCPAGTAVHQLAGQSHFVCLAGQAP